MARTVDWHTLGKVQYRKWKIYEMEYNHIIDNLSDYIIIPAPFAGPIAIVRDTKKLVKLSTSNDIHSMNHILLFNSSGKKLCDIPFRSNDKDIELCKLFWSEEMHLFCIYSDGKSIVYTIDGELDNTFHIPIKSNDFIVNVTSWENGMIVLTDQYILIQILDIDTTKPRIIEITETSLSNDRTPTCINVLAPRFVKSGLAEIFIGTSDCSLLIITKQGATDMKMQESLKAPINHIAIAPNGLFLALFTQDGMLTVCNTALDNKILAFDTQSSSSPLQMLWCGEDAVLLYWKSIGLIMVGPFGSWIKFPYNEYIILSQEPDCCRIYSKKKQEILMRVPISTEAICKIGSTSPSAMLFDALEAFDNGDAKADESIRSIQINNQLEEAITQCIDAAGCEFDLNLQKLFLRAAAYGKTFIDDEFDSELFVDTCRKIRTLTALRNIAIAMPLTITQYDILTPEIVISRLVSLKHHFLALKICEYLKISPDCVLVHWACEKIKKSAELSDEDIIKIIRNKLTRATYVSYSEIASCAEKIGRRRLATMFLDLEENAVDQIPLLLSMGEFELAIKKSIESADTDLMYMALLHIESTLKSIEEFKYVLFREEAYREGVDLMISYYRQTKSSFNRLEMLWRDAQGVPTTELGDHDLRNSYKVRHDIEKRIDKLKLAISSYTAAKALFHAKTTEEQIDLIQEQLKLEQKTGNKHYLDLSVSDTIYLLCKEAKDDVRQLQHATAIAKKFKVPDKRYYRVKIRALAETHQWELLHKFSNEKKIPPCGFKPFAVACLHEGERGQAESYAARITAVDEKFDTFIHMEMWSAALEVATKQKDPEKLSAVRNQCSDPLVHQQVDLAAQQLGFIG